MKYTCYPGGNLTPRQLAERAMVVAEAQEDGRCVFYRQHIHRKSEPWETLLRFSDSATGYYDIRIEQRLFGYARVGGEDGFASDGFYFCSRRVHEQKQVVDQWCEQYGGKCTPLYLPEDDDDHV